METAPGFLDQIRPPGWSPEDYSFLWLYLLSVIVIYFLISTVVSKSKNVPVAKKQADLREIRARQQEELQQAIINRRLNPTEEVKEEVKVEKPKRSYFDLDEGADLPRYKPASYADKSSKVGRRG